MPGLRLWMEERIKTLEDAIKRCRAFPLECSPFYSLTVGCWRRIDAGRQRRNEGRWLRNRWPLFSALRYLFNIVHNVRLRGGRKYTEIAFIQFEALFMVIVLTRYVLSNWKRTLPNKHTRTLNKVLNNSYGLARGTWKCLCPS